MQIKNIEPGSIVKTNTNNTHTVHSVHYGPKPHQWSNMFNEKIMLGHENQWNVYLNPSGWLNQNTITHVGKTVWEKVTQSAAPYPDYKKGQVVKIKTQQHTQYGIITEITISQNTPYLHIDLGDITIGRSANDPQTIPVN